MIVDEEFAAIVGPRGVVSEPAAMEPFLRDWRGRFRGRARAIILPGTAQEAAAVVASCHRRGLAVVPQGGNTGMCGGATPPATGDAVVIALGRLNRIRHVDLDNATLTCEAGCILADVQRIAEDHDALFPLSLAAEGSAQIGGVLSTNAGGTAVLRYGNARDLVLGVEVVLPDGRIWNGLRGLRKDNTGYDLKHLFIGAEGTLGLITAAVLKLFQRPRSVVTALAALASPDDVVALFRLLRSGFGDRTSAFEMFSRECLDLVVTHIPGARDPFEGAHRWYALIEAADVWPDSPLQAKLDELLGAGLERGIVHDAVVATSQAQQRALWSLRENISEAQRAGDYKLKYDIALPVGAIAGFIASACDALRQAIPAVRIAPFGHVGDGNLHFNLSVPGGDRDEATASAIVYDAVLARHGSFSAEHGIGQLKTQELARYKQDVEYDLFRRIKRAVDPDARFNPGKVFPASS